MAVEYTWYGDSELDTPTLRAFIAMATGGDQHKDGTVFLPGMYVSSLGVLDDEANPAMSLFGFEDRIRATFRFSARADTPTTEHAAALMVRTVIAFASRFGGRGVLLFNGEIAVLQYDDDGVVLASDWEEWPENSEIAPLLTQFPSRVLAQPLL
ncbi:SitI3 family protein [Paractinoplanes durhamensis]|uniref:Uncharacterized protein n=1 Tax=Paractinoplanes durhamensis TaxID=113563 RepID=A0ABQ3ZBG8_9ACTN|nr:SitI3 family protein [Actinoplanes durhamensis]GIE07181.1 hypothetical protein Adu01nite_85310 [Actinoplanes durhamensis]